MAQRTNKIHGIEIPLFLQAESKRTSRLNSKENKEVYLFLVKLYGEVCAICSEPPASNKRLDIEHIDENAFNHYWKNLQLAHHDCNCKKRSKDKNKRKGRIKIPILEDLKFQNGESRLKKIYLTNFINFLEEEFTGVDQVNYKRFLTDAAAVCGLASEQTIQRYIKMFCSEKFNFMKKFTDDRTGIVYLQKLANFNELRAVFNI